MVLRGMYGKWLYRKSAAARIRRIQNEFPDAEQRRAVLSAQGGTSLAAVFGSLALLFVLGSAFTLLLGPQYCRPCLTSFPAEISAAHYREL